MVRIDVCEIQTSELLKSLIIKAESRFEVALRTDVGTGLTADVLMGNSPTADTTLELAVTNSGKLAP
jgi:hypothetical protein